jgi:copper homeostasis protein
METGNPVLVEACVDTLRSARRAAAGGARRLELCANLVEGGTTPSLGLIAAVRREMTIPVHILIRPRGGDFLHDADELDVMLRDIAEARTLGVAGVVIGALTPDGRIDERVTGTLVDAARPLAVTFHRAIDLALGGSETIETLVRLGIERVLTSGRANTAVEGIPAIREMVGWSAGRVTVMAGGGINESNAVTVVRETGVTEIHLRGSAVEDSAMRLRRPGVFMGKAYQPDEYRHTETSEPRIRAVVHAVG